MGANLRLALLIGGLTAGSAWLVQRVGLLYGGPHLAGSTGPEQVYLALPLLVLAASAAVGRWLSRGERATLYAALVVGVSAVGAGMMQRFLPALVTGFYGGFASPTGAYRRYLELVPAWMVPGSFNQAPAVGAFEGGTAVPWAAWALPLACWGAFFLLLFATSGCLVGIFRRRWLETERLGFPLLDLPLGLLGEGLLRSRVFWCGTLIPALLFGINGLHHYLPAVGEISASLDLRDFLLEEPWSAMAPFESPFVFEFSPLLVGLAYLMPVEVSFSTWFFFLVTRFQLLVTHLLGRTEVRGAYIPGHGSPWLDWPSNFPFLMCQARGGLFFLAAFSLWTARRSLGTMFSWRRPAVWGFAAGMVGLWLWVMAAGLPPVLAGLALVSYFLLCLAFVRLRIDGGLPVSAVTQILGYLFFVTLGTGPGVFTDSTYVAFGFLAVTGYTLIGMWPAMQLEGLKLGEQTGVAARRMWWAMTLGLVVGLACGAYFCLDTVYDHGLYTLNEQGGARSEARIGRYYNYLIKDAASVVGPTDWTRLAFHGIGAGVTWILAAARQHYLRWPFHPMGFIFGTGFGWLVWGPVLGGWLCKWLTVRYGGATTYRRVRPFFLGLILGEVGMRLLWAVVALWQGEPGMGFRF